MTDQPAAEAPAPPSLEDRAARLRRLAADFDRATRDLMDGVDRLNSPELEEAFELYKPTGPTLERRRTELANTATAIRGVIGNLDRLADDLEAKAAKAAGQ